MGIINRLVDYDRWNKKDLYKIAKALGLHGRSSMTKGELVYELKQHCPATFAQWRTREGHFEQLQMAL
jgi:hypothetical protein